MLERPVTSRARAAWIAALLIFLAFLLVALANFSALWAEWGPLILLPFFVAVLFLKKGISKLCDRPWV